MLRCERGPFLLRHTQDARPMFHVSAYPERRRRSRQRSESGTFGRQFRMIEIDRLLSESGFPPTAVSSFRSPVRQSVKRRESI
jgi:hypothetical protein